MDIQVLYKDLTDNTLQMNIDSGYYSISEAETEYLRQVYF